MTQQKYMLRLGTISSRHVLNGHFSDTRTVSIVVQQPRAHFSVIFSNSSTTSDHNRHKANETSCSSSAVGRCYAYCCYAVGRTKDVLRIS